ncbi:hypothetical protein Asp14428_74870 [Actinoplanes sp. NBRC 14428]|nr:hypothetical protein Asp14428_74870 [Actinoplanes sp. NBRC 14428]
MTDVGESSFRVAGLLRHHRLSAGYTQEELAGRAGVAVRTVRNLELGRVRRPRRHTLERLADQLRLTAADRGRLLDARPADPYAPGTPPSAVSLPAALTDFTGRSEPLERIAALADGDGTRTVVISGPPGIGKTSLAVQAAHQLADRFPAGVFFVSLRGMDDEPAAPADAVGQVLAALDVAHPPRAADDRTAAYRTATSSGNGLLVLDNARDEAHVRPLLPAGPGWLTLVTSRGPLGGLSAARIVLDALTERESHGLLSRAVGADRIAMEPAAAAELSRLCGGLPLALRVTANRLVVRPEWSVRSLAERLRDEQHRLDVLHAGDLGVRSAFQLSYRLLDEPARRTLRLLSAAPLPTWSGPLVAALTGADELTAERTVDTLVDAGLANTTQSRDRIALHDLLALFAADRSAAEDEPGERLAAQDRLAEHLLGRCSTAGAWLDPDRPPAARGGGVGALAGSPVTHAGSSVALAGGAVSVALATYPATTAAYSAGATASPAAPVGYSAAPVGYPATAAYFAGATASPAAPAGYSVGPVGGAGSSTADFAGLAPALAWLDQEKAALWWAVRHAAAHGRYRAVLTAARDLYWYSDRRHTALPWTEFFHLAVHAARALGDVRQEARQENNLGWALRRVHGRPEQAYGHHVTALRLSREAADRVGEGWALRYLGAVLATRGDLTGAMTQLTQARDIFATLEDHLAGAVVARAQAELLRRGGDPAAARDVATTALHGATEPPPAPAGDAPDLAGGSPALAPGLAGGSPAVATDLAGRPPVAVPGAAGSLPGGGSGLAGSPPVVAPGLAGSSPGDLLDRAGGVPPFSSGSSGNPSPTGRGAGGVLAVAGGAAGGGGARHRPGFVVRGHLRVELGLAFAALDQPARAIAMLTAALADFGAADDAGGSGKAHLALADVACTAGRRRAVTYHLNQAATFFVAAEDPAGLAEVQRIRTESAIRRDCA